MRLTCLFKDFHRRRVSIHHPAFGIFTTYKTIKVKHVSHPLAAISGAGRGLNYPCRTERPTVSAFCSFIQLLAHSIKASSSEVLSPGGPEGRGYLGWLWPTGLVLHSVSGVAVSRRKCVSAFPEIQFCAMENRARRPGQQRFKSLKFHASQPAHPKTVAR